MRSFFRFSFSEISTACHIEEVGFRELLLTFPWLTILDLSLTLIPPLALVPDLTRTEGIPTTLGEPKGYAYRVLVKVRSFCCHSFDLNSSPSSERVHRLKGS